MKKLLNEELTAKYCYNALALKKSGSDVERLGTTLFNSKITLTPHQIQAALFAFKSPLSKGVILADEVGLGKTIEAGIVIAQTWFEKRGKVIIVSPASLMKQWQAELLEKFGLESIIIDRKTYNTKLKQGYSNPIKAIDCNIMIFSYQMCSSLKDDIRVCRFELAVVDESHKLRNVHNEKSITANNVKYALEYVKKVLLTATPIQNNLMDLYGLCSLIDEDIFGDKNIFRYNYIKNYDENAEELEFRLKSILHRTLRNQVQPYIQFTNRIPKTFSFELTETEKMVYERIRELLNSSDEESYLIPHAQRHLLVMILCKLMGSSMHSIVFTLSKMRTRLENLRDLGKNTQIEYDEFDLDEDIEIQEETQKLDTESIDIDKINLEIQNLNEIIEMANSVKDESKYSALLDSLSYSFSHLKELGAEEKVLIFTESRRTQDYLYKSLKADGYTDILLYNGSNSNEETKEIYNEWMNKHPDAQQGSKAVNVRTAVLEKFKESGKILIATEAGAEGLNLQFCSLVINYDLPWNPQRVEQRIGRCHRFGQKYDVVVINFISKTNIVEQRIYELLSSKFRLFEEILGSSDAVLGSIEDGKDIEKAIIDIYSSCRTTEEINDAFDKLQEMYKDDISDSMKKTREELLDNFEEDVQQYFTDVMVSTEISISNIERLLWHLLNTIWKDKIKLNEDSFSFSKNGKKYCLSSRNKSSDYIDFSLTTTLGQELMSEAENIDRVSGHIEFDITNYPFNLSKVKELKGKNGLLTMNKVSIDSFEKEEYLIFNGIVDDGTRIDSDVCELLFRLNTVEYDECLSNPEMIETINADAEVNAQAIINESQIKNNQYLSEEIEKINAWADDKIQSVQLNVENMRMQRKELQQKADLASNMKDREILEEEILKLSKKIKQSWLQLAMAEEDVEEERMRMISAIKKENSKESSITNIFTVSFSVV